MPPSLRTVSNQLAQFLVEQRLADVPDAGLLERFLDQRDESSFAVLVRRHGPRVLGVCRRMLGQSQDAEDAFQAAFLILARQGGSLRKRASLGAWLHGVAYRVASKARTAAIRRRRHEQQAGLSRPAARDEGRGESLDVLDEELSRLPERFREPLILCYLDGLTQQEAAGRLSLLPRTLKDRLERGRKLLREALERRGVEGPALLTPPAGAVPAALAGSAVRHAALFAAGPVGQGEIPASVLSLARGVMGVGSLPRACAVVLVLLSLAGLALGIGISRPRPEELRGAAPPAEPVQEQRPLVDRHGDPLPEGALARLGTVRLRQGGESIAAGLSRDGKVLMTAGDDRVVRLWDARTGKSIRDFAQGHEILYGAALTADGKQVAYATAWDAETFDVTTGKRLQKWRICKVEKDRKHAVCYTSLTFSPDGKFLAGAAENATHVWRLSDVKQVHAFPTPDTEELFRSVSFSSDGKLLGTGGKTPAVWDLTTGKVKATLAGHKSRADCTALSPDGKTLAVGYEDGQIFLWNVTTGKSDRVLTGHKGESNVTALAFSADGKTLFSTGRTDQSLRQWDVESGKQVGTVAIDTDDGVRVAVSGDGKTLVVVGDNRIARLWHAKPADKGKPRWEEFALTQAHQSPVKALSFSPDGKTLASAGNLGPARLWDVDTGKEIAVRGGQADRVFALAFSPDGKSLVVTGQDQQMRWCDPRTAKVQRSSRWKPKSDPVAISFCGGKTIVAGCNEEKLHLLDVAPDGKTHHLEGQKSAINHLAFSDDGRTFAWTAGPKVFVWDVATGRRTRELADGSRVSGASYAMALSAGGDRMALEWEQKVQIWDVKAGKRIMDLDRHPYGISALAFSRDGRWLASSCCDRLIRLWETATWKPAGHFSGHATWAEGLAFSPDSRILATGSADTSILLWDLTDRFAKGAGRPLDPKRLDALWADLGEDPEKARRAIWALARSPKESVPYLSGRLGATKADPKRIDRLIVELDDDDEEVRSRATKELQSFGPAAAPAMRKALKTTESAEVKVRLIVCLAQLDSAEGGLRRLRAMAALEYAGTAEARRVLEAIGKE